MVLQKKCMKYVKLMHAMAKYTLIASIHLIALEGIPGLQLVYPITLHPKLIGKAPEGPPKLAIERLLQAAVTVEAVEQLLLVVIPVVAKILEEPPVVVVTMANSAHKKEAQAVGK
jgi:hypothetical protein